jgi:hypothetical protein
LLLLLWLRLLLLRLLLLVRLSALACPRCCFLLLLL